MGMRLATTMRASEPAGIAAGAEDMGHAEDVDQDDEAVRVAPPARADATAQVEGEAEPEGQVPGDDPEAGPHRPVVHREGDEHADDPGVQPLVAEQQEPVQGDRDQGRERELLVELDHGALVALARAQVAGHEQAEHHRGGDEMNATIPADREASQNTYWRDQSRSPRSPGRGGGRGRGRG